MTDRPGARHSRGRDPSRRSAAGILAIVAASAVALVIGIGLHGTWSPAASSKSPPRAAPSATAAATTVQQSSNLPTTLGITDQNLVGEPPAELSFDIRTMKAIGISSVRIAALWNVIQPSGPATYNWSQLDQAVKAFHAAGMSVDLLIDGCPAWAATAGVNDAAFNAQPASAEQFATFSAAVAEHYSADGVSLFEIWNEPNISQFWAPKPDPAAYVADLEAAYSAIKQVDPHAFVISGGLSPAGYNNAISPVVFLTKMYQDGAKGYFDGVGYHPYSYPSLPDDAGPLTGWAKMDKTSPSLRSVMVAYGDASKKIWITEYGAPSSGTPFPVGNTGEADELTQAITYAEQTPWIAAFYIYDWRDGPDNFGLLNSDGTPKPAYYAVAAVTAKFRH